MKKDVFKRVLNSIDHIEQKGLTFQNAHEMIHFDLEKNKIWLPNHEIECVLTYLRQMNMLKEIRGGIDLNPVPTIFCKSNHNSFVEALAMGESIIRIKRYREQLKNNWHCWLSKNEIVDLWGIDNFDLLSQTAFFEYHKKSGYRISPLLIKDLMSFIDEYEHDEHILLSNTLCAIFTNTMADLNNNLDDYKNINKQIADYDNLAVILDILPNRGIPQERSTTKNLQSFYKDTLFHEFNHACPICGINIPSMLIASHIKPFRDCAHIFEAVDHKNGLLLCRNHDFLFDQGYISFHDNGKIIISEDLIHKEDLKTAYMIHDEFILDKIFMSKMRREFLKYHRSNIFKL